MPLFMFSIITYVPRYKIHEEKLFIEKESLKSQLEAAQEEKAKLLKVIHVIKFCVIFRFHGTLNFHCWSVCDYCLIFFVLGV